MKNMPTYEELLAQNSALKKQVKYLGNQTEKAEKNTSKHNLKLKISRFVIKNMRKMRLWDELYEV